jgi:hypothetical protein
MISKIFLPFCLLFFVNTISYSQSDLPEARNSIYLDVGFFLGATEGNIGIGINYERMIHKNFNMRIGVNLCYHSRSGRYDNSKYILGFPLTASYLTSNNNKFEIGLGGGPRVELKGENKYKIDLAPAFKIGYHYQANNNGMTFRLGIDVPANAYVAPIGIGYTFK